MAANDQPRPRRKLHILQLLPNLVSIPGLCSGLTAIRFAVDGRIATAVALMVLRRRWMRWTVALPGCSNPKARLARNSTALATS